MGKYRLKSKQKGSVITLMEVDTECQAWYIQADDRNAALQVLKAMSDEIRCLRNIYLNGDDVTEEVCPLLMTIGDASLPEEEFSEMYGAGNSDGGMDMHRAEDSPEGEADSEPVSSCLLSVMCRQLWLQLRRWKTGLHFLKRQAFLFRANCRL